MIREVNPEKVKQIEEARGSIGGQDQVSAHSEASSVDPSKREAGTRNAGEGAKRNQMHQHQFVAAVVRISMHKFPNAPSLAEAFARAAAPLQRHMQTELDLISDAFSKVMDGRKMKATLHKHRQPLHDIFEFYATLDALERATLTTVNIREIGQLCDDAEIFDQHFAARDLVSAFVKVNIDDELWYQEEKENTPTQLVFDEFCEVCTTTTTQAGESKSAGGRGLNEGGLAGYAGYHTVHKV